MGHEIVLIKGVSEKFKTKDKEKVSGFAIALYKFEGAFFKKLEQVTHEEILHSGPGVTHEQMEFLALDYILRKRIESAPSTNITIYSNLKNLIEKMNDAYDNQSNMQVYLSCYQNKKALNEKGLEIHFIHVPKDKENSEDKLVTLVRNELNKIGRGMEDMLQKANEHVFTKPGTKLKP